MVPRILVIQFRKNERAAELEAASIKKQCAGAAEIECVSALDTQIDWGSPTQILNDYHGVIFGGSGDFDFDGGRESTDEAVVMSYQFLEQLRPLLVHLFSHDIPTLGICFGHQLLGVFAGARVTNDTEQKKTRSHVVRLVTEPANHALLSWLPEAFDAHYVHKDSLDRIPNGASLLIEGGASCRVSALRYQQNIYTTQFHPELTFDDVLIRIETFPGYLPDGMTADSVFSRDSQATAILRNFATRVVPSYYERSGA